ncbi:mannose-1-phosphate guanylyltransferase/mannose-6-phosphate isomerase [Candidatus Pseudothioglobus sp. Uisw_086]|uniref:mannose-1-phosphate guanylyltransferase/mannose-6-phosphate isomerase n=1 Tax=Candidatus Pseudothioglobus sp. Uisw_086 TaxID=3230998 RepID=UPI003A876C4D
MIKKIIPVILSGGSGSRLWPLSRKQHPKQYLNLHGKNSMLQETLMRLKDLDGASDPVIICNIEHRFLVGEQLKEIDINSATIIVEPASRNTAPAIAAVAMHILKSENEDAILLVLPADHIIDDIDSFHKSINVATKHASLGELVTFGVVPNNPNTGYGYIKKAAYVTPGANRVEKFIEKPNKKTAEALIKQDEYLWNSGMFMFKASTLIIEYKIHASDILKSASESVENAQNDFDFLRLDKKSFEACESMSFDYALMEKSKNVVVVSLESDWSDAGSWSALYDIGKKDSKGNVLMGDVMTQDTSNSYIYADHHFVATIGLDDIIVIDTPNATLVSSKEKANEVYKILDKLHSKGRKEQLLHRKVHRPWGWFDSIDSGPHHQVKILSVNINSKLSLQKHFHRAEHWVVIQGKAKVTRDNETMILVKNESTFIPIGTKHSLENIGKNVLKIIEVQTGNSFDEEDIVRFKDIYGRS